MVYFFYKGGSSMPRKKNEEQVEEVEVKEGKINIAIAPVIVKS